MRSSIFEIPEKHLLERIVRVDRLAERLDVQAPEMSGWLHKEIKLRPQHLEKHHLTEIMIGAAGGILKLRVAAEGTGPGFDVLVSKDAPRVRLARVDQGDGPVDPPFEVQEADAKKLLAAYEMVASATTALLQHRKGLAEATLDGERLRTHPKPSLLVERLIATMAPFVQEIAARSHSPGELVLRRLLSGDRREEIFLSKQELKLKLEPLLESNRALFGPLGIDGARPAAPAASLASKPATQATAAAPPPASRTSRTSAGASRPRSRRRPRSRPRSPRPRRPRPRSPRPSEARGSEAGAPEGRGAEARGATGRRLRGGLRDARDPTAATARGLVTAGRVGAPADGLVAPPHAAARDALAHARNLVGAVRPTAGRGVPPRDAPPPVRTVDHARCAGANRASARAAAGGRSAPANPGAPEKRPPAR